VKIFYKLYKAERARVRVMVFKPTLNNIVAISWRSGLLVEETGVSRKKNTDLPQVLINCIT
jgi:hypothetical protein